MAETIRTAAVARRRPRDRRPAVAALGLIVAAAACGEPAPRPMEELVRQGDVFLDPQTLEPFTGTTFSTFEGQPLVVSERVSLRDGAYDGPYEAYFANRQLSRKEYYEEGRRHGPYEWYFDNGRLYERGTYSYGFRNGPYEAYWESGELYERGTYVNGEFDGPRAWYFNGTLIELVTYANGVVDGLYERYGEDGALELRGILLEGRPCGHWLEARATIAYPPCAESTD